MNISRKSTPIAPPAEEECLPPVSQSTGVSLSSPAWTAHHSLIAELPRFLMWNTRTNGTSLADTACQIHQAWIQQKLWSWLGTSRPDVWGAITSLPEWSRQRLFFAPQVCLLVRSNKQPTPLELNMMEQFVRV